MVVVVVVVNDDDFYSNKNCVWGMGKTTWLVGWLVGWLIRFYCIPSLLGYSMPNPVYIYMCILKIYDL